MVAPRSNRLVGNRIAAITALIGDATDFSRGAGSAPGTGGASPSHHVGCSNSVVTGIALSTLIRVAEVWGYDALTGLAYLAAKTSTIKLGTFVVQLGSRSPALLASRVAALWQDGRRDEARQAVPMDLGRLTNLVGTEDGIAERVRKYRAAGITTLLAKLEGDYPYQLTTLERLLEIVTDSGCASAGAARGAT